MLLFLSLCCLTSLLPPYSPLSPLLSTSFVHPPVHVPFAIYLVPFIFLLSVFFSIIKGLLSHLFIVSWAVFPLKPFNSFTYSLLNFSSSCLPLTLQNTCFPRCFTNVCLAFVLCSASWFFCFSSLPACYHSFFLALLPSSYASYYSFFSIVLFSTFCSCFLSSSSASWFPPS